MTILGIETSCDETSAAIMRDGVLLSNVVSSQTVHAEFGGVVPEYASREHLAAIVPIISQALAGAAVRPRDLTLIAATQGPGLIGSLLVGLNAGKAIAVALNVPFLPIHHIEAHIFSTFLQEEHPEFPFLCLVVSGGHTLLLRADAVGSYKKLGSSIDDAAGEAFDKVGKMLRLGFPAGPVIDRLARNGDPRAIEFPRPLLDSKDFNFSFSGLKTSVLYYLRRNGLLDPASGEPIPSPLLENICAGFQAAAVDVLVEKSFRAADEHSIRAIAIAGGVSANSELRHRLQEKATSRGMRIFVPEIQYSTDNAAMVANLAGLQWARGIRGTLHAPAFARIAESRETIFA